MQGTQEGEPAPEQAGNDGAAEPSNPAAATAADDQQLAAANPESSSEKDQEPQKQLPVQQPAADKPPRVPRGQAQQPAEGSQPQSADLLQQQQQQPAKGSQPQSADLAQQQGSQVNDVMKDGGQLDDRGSSQQLPWQLGQAGPECPSLQDMIQPRRVPAHKLQIEYSSLSMADKVRLVAKDSRI